jgi:hypothetical protein
MQQWMRVGVLLLQLLLFWMLLRLKLLVSIAT